MARLLYVDCFAGIAGDMMVGALADLSPETRDAVERAVEALPLEGLELEWGRVVRAGIAATRFQVHVDLDRQHHRSLADIEPLLGGAGLPGGVLSRALAMFRALAEAEGRVHDRPPAEVHFHEVGAVDSIVDVVGVAAGLDRLGATVHASRVPLGRGFVRCEHGTLPLPAPATLELLRGIPVAGTDLETELVTPTGAAVLRTQVSAFGPLPAMRPLAVGWGAGSRDQVDRPGLLRLVLGEALEETRPAGCVVLEANVDDMTGEVAAHAMSKPCDRS